METTEQAKKLVSDTDKFHNSLIEQARAISKFRNILQFVVECINFAEKQFPESPVQDWSSSDRFIPLLTERASLIFNNQAFDPQANIFSLISTASTASTSAFSFITQNYNYLEDKQARSEYTFLAGLYRGVVSSEEDQKNVYDFLGSFNSTSANKFKQANDQFQSLPAHEDPQGPLVAMRSAIDLAIRSLLELTPLTKSERSSLKSVSRIPIIAQYLAKDETSKLDLILANDQLQELWAKLSASKNKKLPRDIAEALMSQATALLNLLARSINIDDKTNSE